MNMGQEAVALSGQVEQVSWAVQNIGKALSTDFVKYFADFSKQNKE